MEELPEEETETLKFLRYYDPLGEILGEFRYKSAA
jgi:hypothetical protein